MTHNMDHKEEWSWCDERLDQYVDGVLPDDERLRMEGLIERHPAFKNELDFARATKHAIDELPAPDCPDFVIDNVYRSIEAAKNRSFSAWLQDLLDGFRERMPRFAPVGAAAAVAAILVFFAFKDDKQTYSAADLARAEAEMAWAFGYIGNIVSTSSMEISGEALGNAYNAPVESSLRDIGL